MNFAKTCDVQQYFPTFMKFIVFDVKSYNELDEENVNYQKFANNFLYVFISEVAWELKRINE